MRIDNKLRTSRSFSEVYSKARRRIYAGRLTFHLLENGRENARLGVSIAKRLAPKAVLRNYIKRINRECFRAWQADLKGFDIVVSVRANMTDLTRVQLYKYITNQWNRLTTQYDN